MVPLAGAERRMVATLSRALHSAARPVQQAQSKYRVAIVGGGSAGVSVAGQLLRKLPSSEHSQIAVIEPSDRHLYQPYWTMVGGLGLSVLDSVRPMDTMIPSGLHWVKQRCEGFDPERSTLILEGGQQLQYDFLVVAAGLQQNFHLIPGLHETLGKNGVSSIYSFTWSPKVWEHIQSITSGKALFTNPNTAVNCGGAPQKIAYLAEAAWRSRGVRDAIDIEYCTATQGIFASAFYREALEEVMRKKGISYSTKTNLVEVDGDAKLATFEREGGELITKRFDFLHVTPPMSAPEFLKRSPLVNAIGFVEVDKETCQHVRYPNVYSMGDCSSLPTSKTYSAISAQAPVVVHNILAKLRGQPESANAAYDGYTACPVLLGDQKLMLCEFNGYTGDKQPTFWPLDQSRGNSLFYIMKRFIFEHCYWHFMPRGRWYGKWTFFEPPIKYATQPTAAEAGVQHASPVSHAVLKAEVELKDTLRGGAQHAEDAHAEKLKPELLGIKTPEMPGNVTLAGNLPPEVVQELAPRYKGWLYLNAPSDPFCPDEAKLKASGCEVEVIPVPSPTSGEAPTGSHAERILSAMSQLPRPLMVQCTSGNRAGAALLLWLSKVQGRNKASATLLAEDLDLKFFTQCSECGPVREWVLENLPDSNEDAEQRQSQSPMSPRPVVIEQFFDAHGSATFTYLVGCTETHEAVLIDPVLGREDRDLACADELGFDIKYIINTHCHADHITSGSAIQQRRPKVKTIISEGSQAAADMKIKDGDKIEFGKYHLDCLATPGHTDGCVSFLLRGPGDPKAVFTGDTLLIRGCGRTDFQAGNSDSLYDSVHKRIFTLPDDTKVYPGHDYRGRNLSTVGEEKQFNPRLTKGKDEFVKIMAELKLPYPKMMDAAVPANMAGGIQS